MPRSTPGVPVSAGAPRTSAAPAGSRLRALVENRARLVAALDATLPADFEDELQTLLVSMLPFYDLPTELLPRNTRAIGALGSAWPRQQPPHPPMLRWPCPGAPGQCRAARLFAPQR